MKNNHRRLYLAAGILIAINGLFSLLYVNFSTDPNASNVLIKHLPSIFYSAPVSLLPYIALAVGLILLGVAERKVGLGIGAAYFGRMWTLIPATCGQ